MVGRRRQGGNRHALVGTVERYEDIYRLCCIRRPEGIIVELAERIGAVVSSEA